MRTRRSPPGNCQAVRRRFAPCSRSSVYDDDFFALGDRCSHEDYSLSEGEVLEDECEIECWKHGSTFDLRTGDPCSLPATKPVPVYPVRIDGDDVIVELP